MMRKLFAILAAGSFMATGVATAAPVFTNATLGLSIQGLAPINLVGAGTVNVTGTTVSVPAGLVSQVGALTVPVTGTSAVGSLVATGIGNAAGVFSLGRVTAMNPTEVCPTAGPAAGKACNVGGGIGGLMGLVGNINVHVIPHVVVIPVNLSASLIGKGGATAVPFVIDAAVWTNGVGLVNTGGTATTPLVALTGSSSPLTLVTPTFVSALGNLLPIFTILTLSGVTIGGMPVPEPGSLLLIGAGIAGLALLGSRRK